LSERVEESAVDQLATAQDIPDERQPVGDLAPPQPVEHAAPPKMSRLATIVVCLVVVASLAWVVVSWRVLRSPLIDAVGEAAGSVFLALLIVSVIGALRRSRRR
jgi:hypothetical protein